MSLMKTLRHALAGKPSNASVPSRMDEHMLRDIGLERPVHARRRAEGLALWRIDGSLR